LGLLRRNGRRKVVAIRKFVKVGKLNCKPGRIDEQFKETTRGKAK